MARSFTFILPYFPTGTMERVDMEGQIATAKVLVCVYACQFASCLSALYILQYVICRQHQLIIPWTRTIYVVTTVAPMA